MSSEPDFSRWREIAAQHPVDYFSTIEGQRKAFRDYAGVPRPAGWSLPSELGPWPDDRTDAAERILCLLPGVSAEIVGDFIAGAWRTRSDTYRRVGDKYLGLLLQQGRAIPSQDQFWIGWRPVQSFVPALKPFAAHSLPVRAFLDRKRLAILDATSGGQLAGRRRDDEAHLAELLRCPASDRNAAWQLEVALYRDIVRAWQQVR